MPSETKTSSIRLSRFYTLVLTGGELNYLQRLLERQTPVTPKGKARCEGIQKSIGAAQDSYGESAEPESSPDPEPTDG